MEWEKEHRRWTVSGKDGEELGQFQAVIATDKNMASPRFSIQNKVAPPLGIVSSFFCNAFIVGNPQFEVCDFKTKTELYDNKT